MHRLQHKAFDCIARCLLALHCWCYSVTAGLNAERPCHDACDRHIPNRPAAQACELLDTARPLLEVEPGRTSHTSPAGDAAATAPSAGQQQNYHRSTDKIPAADAKPTQGSFSCHPWHRNPPPAHAVTGHSEAQSRAQHVWRDTIATQHYRA